MSTDEILFVVTSLSLFCRIAYRRLEAGAAKTIAVTPSCLWRYVNGSETVPPTTAFKHPTRRRSFNPKYVSRFWGRGKAGADARERSLSTARKRKRVRLRLHRLPRHWNRARIGYVFAPTSTRKARPSHEPVGRLLAQIGLRWVRQPLSRFSHRYGTFRRIVRYGPVTVTGGRARHQLVRCRCLLSFACGWWTTRWVSCDETRPPRIGSFPPAPRKRSSAAIGGSVSFVAPVDLMGSFEAVSAKYSPF